jgi:hypothetical protein
MSSQGHGEMTKYFWMFTMRGQGTLEPRRGDKLEDTWATTLPQRLVRCHGRTRWSCNYSHKAVTVKWIQRH